MKKNEWHYNKDYRSDSYSIWALAFIVLVFVIILFVLNKDNFNKYNWDSEEYVIEEGDTVDAVIRDYYDTWCVGTGVSFSSFRDHVYGLNSDVKNLNKVRPGDVVKMYYNPTKE